MIKLKTDRLLIRNFIPADEEQLYETIRTYNTTEYAKLEEQDTGHKQPDERVKYKEIVEWFAKGNDYLAVVLKSSSQMFGLIAK